MLEFAFYVDLTKDGKNVYLHKYGEGVSKDCAAYAKSDWYGWAKELKATFSDSYPNSNGDMIISYMRALEYEGEFKGIVAVDISVAFFEEIVTKNNKYDSMTDCLVCNKTGKECDTEYRLVTSKIDKKQGEFIKKQGWKFDRTL